MKIILYIIGVILSVPAIAFLILFLICSKIADDIESGMIDSIEDYYG